MSVTGDPIGDVSLVGGIAAIVGGVLARFGPVWVRSLGNGNGAQRGQADILHKRIGELRDELNGHRVEDAEIHGRVGAQMDSLGQKIDAHAAITRAGFDEIKGLIQNREG